MSHQFFFIVLSVLFQLLQCFCVLFQFMGDRVNAMQDYNLALKEDPTYALAYFNAANIYFHSRQFKQVSVQACDDDGCGVDDDDDDDDGDGDGIVHYLNHLCLVVLKKVVQISDIDDNDNGDNDDGDICYSTYLCLVVLEKCLTNQW